MTAHVKKQRQTYTNIIPYTLDKIISNDLKLKHKMSIYVL